MRGQRAAAGHRVVLLVSALLLLLPGQARADRGMSTNILKGLYTNWVRTTPDAGNPNLRTRTYAADAARAFARAKEVTARMAGWKIVSKNPAAGVLKIEARTKFMHFVDDVTIRVIAGEGGGSVVNVESRSRVGLGDFGTNARRVSHYLEKLDETLDKNGEM